METLVHKPTNRTVTVQPAASRCVQRKAVQTRFFPRVQTSLKISSPKDPAEKEADLTAKRILRIAIPDNTLGGVRLGSSNRVFGALRAEEKEKKFQRSFRSPYIARFAESGIAKGNVFRKTEGQPDISSNLAADIQSSRASGSPLPLSTRAFMEPRFRADFSTVKIHTGEKAAKLSRQLNAHAFTVSDHIFFGKDKFRPESDAGKELIAHELTHTIQQGGAVQRKEDVTVTQRSQPMVQRGIISEVLDYFADKAYNIPGFRMFTIVIGFNPINMEKADRSGANILRAIIEFLPGGHLIVEALENHGVFQKVGAWIEQQFATLASIGSEFKASLDAFIDSLGWRDVFHLGSVWDRAKALFMNPVNRLINFAKGLFNGIIKFIKDAILRPLAKLAEGTRGYDLLKAVLGEDPITGDPVPQTADTLIGGFMKLIGQEEIWENIKKANAIPRAWAWFKNALSGLMSLVRSIPGRFIAMFQSLTIWDIVLLPKAFAKIVGVFVGIAADFISWAGGTIWSLLEIIFSVLAPAVMPYLKKAAAAFRTILKDPIGFVGNLVRAAKQGFLQFAARFLTHLKNSLIQWLTGALPGVYIPQAFNLREIIKFVLSVLGLTWANIRAKLVKAVGETAVKAMETGFDIVVTLVTQGPAAAWDKIKEALANLQEMVIQGVMDYVKSKIVEAAVTKLLSMLSPAGAFIQAIIAIYNTVMFFIERLKQIAQVAMSFIDSIAAIASGVIATAANKVETTLAGFLTLVISFLARIAGLGKVSDAVMNIINKVRAPIDRGLDMVVNWIVTMARSLGRFVAQAGVPQDPGERLRLAARAAVTAARALRGVVSAALLAPAFAGIRVRYGLTNIQAYERNGKWRARIVINPETDEELVDSTTAAAPGGASRIQSLIGTQVVRPVPGSAATLIVSGDIPGYQIRLGSDTEQASIRKVRAPAGATALPDVHIDDGGFLREGARPGQRRSDEATKLASYRQVASDLGLGAIHPEVTEANVTATSNSTVRNALRTAILDDPRFQTLANFNQMVSRRILTGSGMLGELFEAYVVRHFGSAAGIEDRKVKYKVGGEVGIMDRYSGTTIVEIKSRLRPTDVPATTADDDIPRTRFDVAESDRRQFARYAQLVNGQGEIISKSGANYIIPPTFTGAQYHFNMRGVALKFLDDMPQTLKSKTTFLVRNAPVRP